MQKALKFCISLHLGNLLLPEVNFIFSHFSIARLFIHPFHPPHAVLKPALSIIEPGAPRVIFLISLLSSLGHKAQQLIVIDAMKFPTYMHFEMSLETLLISMMSRCVSSADFSPQH